jgi:N,N'-diacetyllegionaminate synthase
MIICEIGLNHLGDEKYAKKYIKKIIKERPDAVIFHIREEKFYEIKKFSKYKLSDKFYTWVKIQLEKNKIKLGIALANPNYLDFCEKINVDFYKIFSIHMLNFDLIEKVLKTKKNIFISTGISNEKDISKIIKKFKKNHKQLTLIHTQLTNEIEKVNLRAIPHLQNKLHTKIAYGNHAENINVLYLSVAYNPSDIIFYIKGDKKIKHPDEKHAVKLDSLDDMILNLKELKKALGSNRKIKMKPQIK